MDTMAAVKVELRIFFSSEAQTLQLGVLFLSAGKVTMSGLSRQTLGFLAQLQRRVEPNTCAAPQETIPGDSCDSFSHLSFTWLRFAEQTRSPVCITCLVKLQHHTWEKPQPSAAAGRGAPLLCWWAESVAQGYF